MKGHPTELKLALLAGGECGSLSRYFLNRHVRDCRECTAQVAGFEMMRAELADMAPPDLDWERLAREMRANIHVGLEAGECVRPAPETRRWSPRFAVAFASLLLLMGAGFWMKDTAPGSVKAASPVLESTGSGLELRSGANSMTILNRHGAVAGQTVSAQGEIGARYIDGETGAVTINHVYLE